MNIEFNVDKATFILGVCGCSALAVSVTQNPWWLFGLFFMCLWAIFNDKAVKDGKEGKRKSD